MSATLLPLADHGDVVSALPFVAPMALIVAGLLVLVARDRLAARRSARPVEGSSRPRGRS